MRTGNRRQRQQAAGEEMLGPPLSQCFAHCRSVTEYEAYDWE
jgi:hypothetical protein